MRALARPLYTLLRPNAADAANGYFDAQGEELEEARLDDAALLADTNYAAGLEYASAALLGLYSLPNVTTDIPWAAASTVIQYRCAWSGLIPTHSCSHTDLLGREQLNNPLWRIQVGEDETGSPRYRGKRLAARHAWTQCDALPQS